MGTLTLPSAPSSVAATALRTGIAFAATVALFYALCTLVWLAAPVAFMRFMNNLFHGLDFTPLVAQAAFSWSGFLAAAVVLSTWAFLAGCFFGWLRQRIGA
ncbi:DUF5676 family membrane protein [Caldimonas sp. KR1-144]|uniref:DUF5676 family membrane protein n=1 Tax=Caldimonas sp. KR1-144 TaxID=3400911 RepID=UPI003C0CC152